MKIGFRANNRRLTKIMMLTMFIIIPFTGCAVTSMEAHKKGMESLTEKEYFIPKKPIDRHFIGCAWSKQFGPIEDPAAADIRIKVERSFDTMQQNFAYNVGVSLGGQSILGGQSTKGEQGAKGGGDTKGGQSSTKGGGNTKEGGNTKLEGGTNRATVELGIEGGADRKSNLEDVQIISPVSFADIPFEMNIPYITEALRLGNFRLKSEAGVKAGITASVSSVKGGVKGAMEGDAGTTGEGLVVAYKLHMIDPKTYSKWDSGGIALELDKTIDFPNANLFVRSLLRVIEAGANQPLPPNLLWSCDRAEAKSKDMVAAWVIDLRSKDPGRKSLQIAFPAFPKIEDCQNFSGVIYSRIDPLTDKIIREKINITLIEEELSDSLKSKKWEARMSLVDESFNIKLLKEDDLVK
jgi:hypothetical protein